MFNNFRFVASILVEAATPLNISTGEKDLVTDSAIRKDANGLPIIPGSSLAGVLRHNVTLTEDNEKSLFGFHEHGKSKQGQGSRLILSHAHFVGKENEVMEGISEIDWSDTFYQKFKKLPIRQHTKISHNGASDASEHGKFDEQVVYKGSRFRFEIELIGTEDDSKNWRTILNQINSPAFRIGGGTRKGFGKLKVIQLQEHKFDLNKEMQNYLEKSASLKNKKYLDEFDDFTETKLENWQEYVLQIEPENFWLFGSGLSDDEVDMTPTYEEVIVWEEDKPKFSKKKILIPATSIKGAFSHRTAYHYNKLEGNFADELESEEKIKDYVEEKNAAVKALFGCAKNGDERGSRGNVILSDIYITKTKKEKILEHVAIDRFTGGAKDGALYDEKVIAQKASINLRILVNKNALEEPQVQNAFELTLDDICQGSLPLGGGVMRGHGCFKGEWR